MGHAAIRATRWGLLVSACVAVALSVGISESRSDQVVIGDEKRAARLFSHPANCHEVCYLDQSLAEVIELYLRSSATRDGLHQLKIEVEQSGANIVVNLDGPGAEKYAEILPIFFDAGDLAYKGAQQLLADRKWRYNWRLYLPLGLPLSNAKSVQLLHFPPDYVLENVQDYLLANTTKRWAELLVLNGAQEKTTDQYQAIVDIAPISAPASDGQKLEGIYDNFEPYIDALLDLWLFYGTNNARPLVVFGGPAREYFKDRYGKELDVLTHVNVQMEGGKTAAALGANHPSRFYNAINSYLEQNNEDKKGAILLGIKLAHDDLIAACWQVSMSADSTDGASALSACKTRWQSKDREICNIVVRQRFAGDPEAQEICDGDLDAFRGITENIVREMEERSSVVEIQ
jgi:hypothetical protein